MMLPTTHVPEPFRRGLGCLAEHLRNLEFPSRGEFVDALRTLDQLEAVVLVLGGAALLLFGFKYFKAFVIADAAAIGGIIGMYLGGQTGSSNMPLVMGLAGAVLLGALAFPGRKIVVCLLGAGAGGLMGLGIWSFAANALNRPGLLEHAWAGGAIGALGLGLLAWVASKPVLMIFTSVQGSVMLVSGGCALLLAWGRVADDLQPQLHHNAFLLTVLMAVPAALGFAYQHAQEFAKVQKKRKVTEKPPV